MALKPRTRLSPILQSRKHGLSKAFASTADNVFDGEMSNFTWVVPRFEVYIILCWFWTLLWCQLCVEHFQGTLGGILVTETICGEMKILKFPAYSRTAKERQTQAYVWDVLLEWLQTTMRPSRYTNLRFHLTVEKTTCLTRLNCIVHSREHGYTKETMNYLIIGKCSFLRIGIFHLNQPANSRFFVDSW